MLSATTILVSLCLVASSAGQQKKPNVILFLTDDQDNVLDGMVSVKYNLC